VPENIEVVIRKDEHMSPVQADSVQLYRVFSNMILNAAQAMPEGGRLTIQSETVDTGWIAISFRDTGVGVAAENLPRLFEPLFTTRAAGVGFGLSIAKSLVEGHGGTIEVQSNAGQGSNFMVKLPVTEILEAAVA
jgi:signal transduction histidine kinase